jgi:hypothetical protein
VNYKGRFQFAAVDNSRLAVEAQWDTKPFILGRPPVSPGLPPPPHPPYVNPYSYCICGDQMSIKASGLCQGDSQGFRTYFQVHVRIDTEILGSYGKILIGTSYPM